MIYVDNFRVRKFDDMNIVLEELKDIKDKKTGEYKKGWVVKGYYGTISQACKAILRTTINNELDGIDDIQTLVDKLEECTLRIISACRTVKLDAKKRGEGATNV